MDYKSLFENCVSENRLLIDDQLTSRYSHIWKMDAALDAAAVLLPENTQEVSAILEICCKNNLKVVTHGGLTNLVGGTETTTNDVVISMERMNIIEEIDASSRTMTVQSGVILENIHDLATQHNLMFPLNFGARGSAQIGGIISTNAGGLRVLRYGMTRQLVLGIEAVLADGTIINSLKKIIKDNSAYDLKQLFIGSEGTLGIVTRAVLKLEELPTSRFASFIGVNKYDDVVRLLKHLDSSLAGKLTGFELIWANSYKKLTSAGDYVKPPLPYDYNYYVLVEAMGSDPTTDYTALENAVELALETEMIEDAVMAQTDKEVEWFFKIREDVSNLVDDMDYDQHFDISIPVPLIGDYIEERYDRLEQIKGVSEVYAFGHVADGNIHFIIGKENESIALKKQIDQCIYDGIKAAGGSVSAEHGIGVHKKAYLELCRTPEEITLMKSLKTTLDSKGILNAGKIF